jgi:hypothetical protein
VIENFAETNQKFVITYAQRKDAPLAHQQIVASFGMANEFTIVLAGSSILLITVNYEKNSKNH